MTTARKSAGMALVAAYVATIAAANWAIHRYGFVSVGFGLVAPAGVYFAGLAFTLRDLTQDTLGRRAVVGAILAGAVLSWGVTTAWPGAPIPGGPSPAQLAVASATAFLVSELADFTVYTPLRDRGWLRAVAASNAVGLVVDSALLLWLAFGSQELLAGQIVGKAWMTLLAVILLGGARAVLRKPQHAQGA
jgi:uncharacterized PurR-regulated membrane protein YhhQ (DUF165 family)